MTDETDNVVTFPPPRAENDPPPTDAPSALQAVLAPALQAGLEPIFAEMRQLRRERDQAIERAEKAEHSYAEIMKGLQLVGEINRKAREEAEQKRHRWG